MPIKNRQQLLIIVAGAVAIALVVVALVRAFVVSELGKI